MSLTSYRAAPPRVRSLMGLWYQGVLFEIVREFVTDFIRSGDDLLSHILRCSTIGMIALNFRVRDGIGCFTNTMITGPVKVCQTSVCSRGTLLV